MYQVFRLGNDSDWLDFLLYEHFLILRKYWISAHQKLHPWGYLKVCGSSIKVSKVLFNKIVYLGNSKQYN